MQSLNNITLQKFIDKLIKYLKEENEKRSDLKLNIPFIISTLYQSFKNDAFSYTDFIEDLDYYSDYCVLINEPDNSYNGIIDVLIELVKYTDKDYCDYGCPDYSYKLSFSYDERYYGYCECTPDMPDYRKDKECCGHGCDADFCEFDLYKIIRTNHGSWQGDEHDYWDFEDNFYKTDEELHLKKQKEEKECKIEMYKKYIEEYTRKISELESK